MPSFIYEHDPDTEDPPEPPFYMWLICEECQDFIKLNDWRYEPNLDAMSYGEYLKTKHWNLVRKTVIKHRKVCACCGSTLLLHVHHREYPAERMQIVAHMLVLLCKVCHGAVHGKGKAS